MNIQFLSLMWSLMKLPLMLQILWGMIFQPLLYPVQEHLELILQIVIHMDTVYLMIQVSPIPQRLNMD